MIADLAELLAAKEFAVESKPLSNSTWLFKAT
jgi:hypothetical protein